jgi:Mn-dependent DtxR family transcriptional regulator
MLSRTTENYLRVISELIDKKGYARSNDISSILGVSAPSVTQMLQKLDLVGGIYGKSM